jgi:cell division septum initiation protein DivIVA
MVPIPLNEQEETILQLLVENSNLKREIEELKHEIKEMKWCLEEKD